MNDEYGVELAKRGYVVIATPYPRLSDYNPDLKKLGYESGTMKAIWDNMPSTCSIRCRSSRRGTTPPSAIRSAGTTASTRPRSTSG